MTVSDEHDSERPRPFGSGDPAGMAAAARAGAAAPVDPAGPAARRGSSYAAPADPRPSYPPGIQPYPVQQHRSATPERGRVSGWVWPLVSALALVIGVIGGVLGGAVYENLHDHSTEGQVSGGLADSGVESRAPLPAAQPLGRLGRPAAAAEHGAGAGAVPGQEGRCHRVRLRAGPLRALHHQQPRRRRRGRARRADRDRRPERRRVHAPRWWAGARRTTSPCCT